jgi:hypothetical protein
MKKILFFLLSLSYVVASAEGILTSKEVYCDKPETIIGLLKGKDYEEIPLWFGKERTSKAPNYMLFVNHETKSWTMIQFNNELACVLGAGENFNMLTKKSYT